MKNKPLVTFKNVLKTYKSEYAGRRALEKYKWWFPLYPSVKLAGIVADLMSDGHLQRQPKLRLDFTSKYKNELKRFGKEIFSIFKVNGRIRPCTTNKFSETYNYGVNCNPLGRVLVLCGVPRGSKIKTRFNIPSWILSEKKFFKRFVQRMFSCEGTVSLEKQPFIELCMYKSVDLLNDGMNFFSEIKDYLYKYFNIKTTNPFTGTRVNIRKDGIKTKAIRLKIKRRKSIVRFAKFIGFDNREKQQKLQMVVNGVWL